jgi:hypothetical protein
MSDTASNRPPNRRRPRSIAGSQTCAEAAGEPWQAVERQFSRGLLTDTDAIAAIRRVLSESLPILDEAGPAVLQCLRIADRMAEGSPQGRQAANAFRRWSDLRFPRADETLDYFAIDDRRLVYMLNYDLHTTWLRSRSRSAPLGLSLANRMSLLDLALEFGIPAAVGDAMRWRSAIRGGIAAPGLVEPALTEWAVRALLVLLHRRGTRATALAELLTALRDPLLAPIVARLATNTMLTGRPAREQVAEGVEALRCVLVSSRDRWTADEMYAAEAAADWLADRIAATTFLRSQ